MGAQTAKDHPLCGFLILKMTHHNVQYNDNFKLSQIPGLQKREREPQLGAQSPCGRKDENEEGETHPINFPSLPYVSQWYFYLAKPYFS